MTTEASSSDELANRDSRRRRIVASAAVGIIARLVNAAVQVVSVALAVRYLGSERYGLWVNLLVLAVWTGLSNFGLGAALVSQIAHAEGSGMRERSRQLISSATATVTALSILLLAVFLVAWPFVPWHAIFGLSTPSLWEEADWGVLVCVVLILATMPLRLGEPVLNGHQRGHLVNACYIAGTLASLGGLICGIMLELAIPSLLLLTLGLQLSGTFISWYLAHTLGFIERFRISEVNWPDIRNTVFSGGQFFLLQIYLLVTQSMTLVIAAQLGSEAVTPYAVTQRLFFLIISIVNTCAAPLWPAFGEAAARGDRQWIRRFFWRAVLFTAGVWIVLAALLAPFGKQLIGIWSGPEAVPSTPLLMFLMFFALFQSLQIVIGMLLNGLHRLRVQVMAGGVTALLQVGGAFWLANHWGVEGVAAVQCCTTGLIALPILYVTALRAMR